MSANLDAILASLRAEEVDLTARLDMVRKFIATVTTVAEMPADPVPLKPRRGRPPGPWASGHAVINGDEPPEAA